MFSDSPPSSVLIQESVDTTLPSACLTLSYAVEERPDAYGPLGSLGYAFVWAIRDRKVSLYPTGRAADAVFLDASLQGATSSVSLRKSAR